MDFKEFDVIKHTVCSMLDKLDPKLTYHSMEHTMDVVEQSERIAKEEGISGNDFWLLKVAALYHDTGFLRIYHNHEEMSCEIFLENSIRFQFSEEEKEKVKGIIMATKIPQKPHTILERIICDADLDYLGRKDFFTIGDQLRKEFLTFGIINNDEEWDKLQLSFLKNHHYHTASSQIQREGAKQKHIEQLLGTHI
jgi:uncharacterized protein